jgi:nicotinate phosphoribosyltransferase
MNFNLNKISNSIYRETIIHTLSDNDLYKFNMQQAMLHRCQYASDCTYEFHCRTDEDLTTYIPRIRVELEKLCNLQFTEDEIHKFRAKPWFKSDYLQFLKNFKLDYKTLYIRSEVEDGRNVLRITATGSAVDETLFEIHVMSIISEVRNQALYPNITFEDVRKPLYEKIKFLKSKQKELGLAGFHFADFGTRRRASYEAQFVVNQQLLKQVPDMYIGTSNVHIANELGVAAIGTQAHEWFQLFQQGNYRLKDSIFGALENWVQEYRGELGYALTDIITMDAFVANFDKFFGKLYDGLRHDSGCPFEWGEKAIRMYEALGIDPKTKTLIFSDGLNMELSVKLWQHFHKYIKVSFGIGTHLTNDIEGVTPINMVMKLLTVNGEPTAKISDSSGKTLCKDEKFVENIKRVFKVPA